MPACEGVYLCFICQIFDQLSAEISFYDVAKFAADFSASSVRSFKQFGIVHRSVYNAIDSYRVVNHLVDSDIGVV